LVLTLVPVARAIDPALTLEIGDPARKAKKAPLVLDAITDTRTGELLSPAQLAARLGDARIVLVGETHTDMNFHRAQLRVIEELHRAGRRVLIGLEMFPYTKQEYLDAWVAGHYTEEGFLELAGWYDTWGTHWEYYQDIFLFARDKGLPMYALNTPREVVAAVRKKGLDELTDEEKAHIPPEIDTENDEHYRLFKTYFAEEEDEFHSSMSEEQWRGMFAAQCTWDATFAHNSLEVLEKHPEPETVLVVLVGAGHATYDLGIQRQVKLWSDVEVATVIPIPVQEWDEDEVIGEVQASYADYIWGMPKETDPIYPTLGVSTRSTGDEGQRTVIYVAEDSVAEEAGFQLGDLLLEVDGQPVPDKETFARLLAGKRWGDTAVVKVQRGEETVDLAVAFRRELPEPDEEDS
jgi:uncharacterized iron-regulated protein